MSSSCRIPWAYSSDNPNGRTRHDDWLIPWLPAWLQPWALIPRRWTGHCFPMPPKQIAGTAPAMIERERQVGYPIASGYYTLSCDTNPSTVLCPDPVPPIGCWTLQAVYSTWLGCWIPCYFAFSAMVFGRRLHFNGPLKPDVTLGDWFWWFECSLSWTKVP